MHVYKVFKHTVGFIYLLAVTLFCNAQSPSYYVQHYNSENGLPNTIKGLIADNNGYVWIATEAGLVRFDGSRFETYDRSEKGLPVTRLFNVGITSEGKVFTDIQGMGYHYVTPNNTLKFISKEGLFHSNEPIPVKVGIADIILSKFNSRFKAGLIGDFARPIWKNTKGLHFNNVALLEDGYYYINTSNALMKVDTSLQNFTAVSISGTSAFQNKKKQEDSIPVSLINGNNAFYVHRADTIYKLIIAPDKKSVFATTLLFVGSISNINGLLQLPDSSTIIVSTSTDGIYVFKKQNFTTVTLKERNANVFYAQTPFGENGVLTSKGIVMTDKYVPFQDNFFAYSILKTNNNSYYLNRREIDSFSLCVLNSRLERVQDIPIAGGGINCMRQLKDHSIWISTSSEFMGRVDSNKIKWYKRPMNLSADFLINTFIEESPNKFWIGGKKGLAKIDLISNEVQLIDELKDAYVRSLYQDAAGVLWIGTYGSGFSAWYKNQLITFPIDKNQYLKYVHCFMPDRSGRVWMSTNHGLFMVAVKDLYAYIETKTQPYYYYFDNTAGFLSNEFNGGCHPAGIILGNGKFSLPSLNGLVQFFPDSIQPIFPGAQIFVDKIVADDSIYSNTKYPVSIPNHTERLQLYVSSPYFGNSYNQNLEYNIDESDNKWRSINKECIIELNNLEKGNHTIWIRKQTSFGKDGWTSRRFDFMVEPAFSETYIFKLAVLAAIAGLLYLLYRLRVQILMRQKRRLEKEVYEKTKEQQALVENLEIVIAELEESKEDLQNNMRFKENLAMIIAHDLQSPLRFLSDAMKRMHENNKYADEEANQLSKELNKTTTNIYRFVEDFSVWIRKVNIKGHVDPKPIYLNAMLDELKDFFSELEKSRGNKIHVNASPHICVTTSYELLKIILRNIVDNANKFTADGNIYIEAISTAESATIEIRDTGIGMKTEVVQRILKHASEPSLFSYGKESDTLGFGYRFITDFCKLMKISLHVKSELGKGTSVILSNFKLCSKVHSTITPKL